MPFSDHRPRLFCFGMGYCAHALARILLAEGWNVAGTCKDPDRVETLQAEGLDVILMNRNRPLEDPTAVLADTTHVLCSIPPDQTGDMILHHHWADIAAIKRLIWAGYFSTTGVYGDTDGALVNESAKIKPSNERGRRRAKAETEWREIPDPPIHIFRLAGIYGPGRSALDKVRDGTAKRIDKPDHGFSRVHVEDIASVVRASMAHPNPGAVYNVCDDDPAAPADVVTFACELLGVEPPPLVPFEEAAKSMSPLAQSFWQDRRRVDNSRIKKELGVTLQYPDYKAGLRAIHESETGIVDPNPDCANMEISE